jgi:hypothetical protein
MNSDISHVVPKAYHVLAALGHQRL